MSHGRLVSLVAILGLLLIPDSILAQKEQEARVVRIDVGITVPVAPIWKSRSLAGSTKLELTAADGRLREAGREVVAGVTFTRGGDEAVGKRALDDIDFVRKNLYTQSGELVSSVLDRYPFLTEVKTTPPVLAQTGVGEIAMAASYNGVKVAIATNSGWAKSSDSGVTFTGANNFPASILNQGDPALAYGGKTDNFYLGYLGRPNGTGAAGSGSAVNGCTVSVDRSKDGQNYAWAGHARFCSATATAGQLFCSPDQALIAPASVPPPSPSPLPDPPPNP